MKILKNIFLSTLLTVLVALFIAFAISNRDVVMLSFAPLPYTAEMPKFLLVLICVAIGVILGGLAGSLSLIKARMLLKRMRLRAAALQNEQDALKVERGERLPLSAQS